MACGTVPAREQEAAAADEVDRRAPAGQRGRRGDVPQQRNREQRHERAGGRGRRNLRKEDPEAGLEQGVGRCGVAGLGGRSLVQRRGSPARQSLRSVSGTTQSSARAQWAKGCRATLRQGRRRAAGILERKKPPGGVARRRVVSGRGGSASFRVTRAAPADRRSRGAHRGPGGAERGPWRSHGASRRAHGGSRGTQRGAG